MSENLLKYYLKDFNRLQSDKVIKISFISAIWQYIKWILNYIVSPIKPSRPIYKPLPLSQTIMNNEIFRLIRANYRHVDILRKIPPIDRALPPHNDPLTTLTLPLPDAGMVISRKDYDINLTGLIWKKYYNHL